MPKGTAIDEASSQASGSVRVVLDAWAVLAWLQGEPSGAGVRDLVAWAEGNSEARRATLSRFREPLRDDPETVRLAMNVINLGEVFYIVGRVTGSVEEAQDIVAEIRRAPIEIVRATHTLVFRAATIKMRWAISYTDAFAVATAQAQSAFLLTGDPEIKALDPQEVSLLWLGGR